MTSLHLISSASWGGLEIYSSELVVRLKQAGHQVFAMVTPNSRVEKYLKENGVKTFAGPKKIKSKLLGQMAVRRILKKNLITDLDIIHCHTRMDLWFAALATSRAEAKIVYNLYMNAPRKKGLLHRWLFGKVSALCSSSEAVCRQALDNFEIAPEKIKLVRYGRDVSLYQSNPIERQKLRDQLQVQKDQIVFLSMARLDEGKGIKEILLAMKHLNEEQLSRTQLWIMGEPTLQSEKNGQAIYEPQSLKIYNLLKAMIESEKYRNHIRHISFQKNFIPYVDACDVFCIASYNETYSLSVIDAELMAKPIVGTNSGGTIEQVGNDERGILVQPHSAEDIARGFAEFLGHPENIFEKGQAARKWSLSQHSWESAIQQTEDIYKSVSEGFTT